MQYSGKYTRICSLIFKLSLFASSLLIALLVTLDGWQLGFAQVADWCGQTPAPIWCSSFEETNSGSAVFPYGYNLHSSPSYTGVAAGWYSSGGYVDRNDSQYTVTITTVRAGLPATITQASTITLARSGETSGKRFVHLNANTPFADANIATTYPITQRNAGIFLSRKLEGDGNTLVSSNPNGLYFSSWYYFPTNYTSTTTANNNLMVMEFMVQSGLSSNPIWRVPWSVHLQGKSGNKMVFRVDERSGTLSILQDDQHKNALLQHTNSPLDVPINKWVHLEVFYKYSPWITETQMFGSYRGMSDANNPGQVVVFQDGVEIYRFEGVATALSAADSLLTYNWMVAAYAHDSNPANFNFYIDDSAISKVRLSAPRELIRNGDITNTLYWRNDNPPYAIYSLDTNAGLSANHPASAKLVITGTGQTNQPNFYQPIKGGMRPGITYTLRFSGKSTLTRTVQAMIYHNGYYPGPFGANNEIEGGDNNIWTTYWNGSCGSVTLNTTVQNFVCPITVSQVVTNGVLGFRVGNYTSTVWLDNVSLVENQNLISNGDFDGAPGWTFNANGSTSSYATDANAGLSVNNGNNTAGKITITKAGANLWEPEFYQSITSTLDAGITYTLRFTAKASFNRTMQIAVQTVSGSDTFLWWESNCGTINLTSTAQNFVCAFQPDQATALPNSAAVVNFLLGAVSGNPGAYNVWIDNVSLSRNN